VRRALGPALITLALILAGCGGGGGDDRLSKEEFIAAADAICKEANDRIEALGEPTLENVSEYVTEAEAISREQLGALRALRPPAEDEATLNGAYDLIEQQIDLAVQGVDALTSGDQAAFQEIDAQITSIEAEADQVARDYGLQECGKED
jgi:hypothetical protein